eukprot:gene12154-biopygen13298
MPLVYDPPPIYRGGPRHAPTPALSHQTCPASFQRSFPSVFPPRSSLCSDEDEDEQMFTVGSSEIPVFSSSDTRSHIDAATPSISHLLSAHGEVTVHKLQVRIGDSAEFGIQDCCCQACLDSWGTPLTQSNRSPDKLARMSNVEDVTMIDWISALRHSFLFELCIDKAEFLPSTHRWDAPPQRHGCPVDGAQCSAVRHNHSEWRCTWAYRRCGARWPTIGHRRRGGSAPPPGAGAPHIFSFISIQAMLTLSHTRATRRARLTRPAGSNIIEMEMDMELKMEMNTNIMEMEMEMQVEMEVEMKMEMGTEMMETMMEMGACRGPPA